MLKDRDENVWKSFRNFPRVNVRTAAELCAHDVAAGGLIIAEGGSLELMRARRPTPAPRRSPSTTETSQ